MKNKIKKIFRKKIIGLSVFFIAVLLFSARLAYADFSPSVEDIPVLSDILEAPLRIGLAVIVTAISFGLGVIQLLTAAFCYIAATLVKWVVTTPVRLTSGGVVDVGWAFCRDFSNMFFIVVLLVIAYATMLKKETFGMKQALIPLILMALLINFSQVIAGVIVDISNIFMNFFVQNGAADAGFIFIKQNVFIKDVLGIGSDKFWGPFAQVFGKPFAEVAGWAIGVVIKGIVGVIFNIVEFLILIAYALILVLRIVIIWILVILSPLAFICYVLPATKSFWQMWWKNFIQWATVGIILLFFLYLAGYLMAHSTVDLNSGSSEIGDNISCKMPRASQPGNQDAIGWGAHIMSEFFCSLLPSIAGLVFLLLGLFLGIQGAGGMPGFAQKIMQAPVRTAGQTAGLATLGYLSTAGARKAGTDKRGRPIKERAPFAESMIGGTAKYVPFLGPTIATGLAKKIAEVREKSAAGLKTLTTDALLDMMKNPTVSPTQKNSVITVFAERNSHGELTDKQLSSISASSIAMSHALGNIAVNGLALRDPARLAKAINKTPKEMGLKMDSRTYANMAENSLRDKDVFDAANEDKARAVYNTGNPDKIKAFNEPMKVLIGQTSFASQAPGGMANEYDRMSSAQKNAKRIEIFNKLEQEFQTTITDVAERERAKSRVFVGLTHRNAIGH